LPTIPDLTLDKPALFAECQTPGHSANMPSLPSVKYWRLGKDWPRMYKSWLLCRVSNPSTRQTCHLSRVSNTGHLAKTGPERTNVGFFAECHCVDTRQRSHFSPKIHRNLSRVRFAEWFYPSTRQKASLPSVTHGKATIYFLFLLFGHV